MNIQARDRLGRERLPQLIRGAGHFVLFALLWCILSGAGPAWADTSGEVPQAVPLQSANIVLDGRVLFPVAGVVSYPAEKRARLISERIRALADDPKFAVDQLRSDESQGETWVLAGDQRILQVFDVDAQLQGIDRSNLAKVIVVSISDAVTHYRQERSADYLVRQSVVAVLMLLGTAALLWVMRWLSRRFFVALRKRYHRKLEKLGAKSAGVLNVEQFEAGLERFVGALGWLIAIAVILGYVTGVLEMYPWTRHVARWVVELVLDPLRTIFSEATQAIPNFVFLGVLYVIVRQALHLLELFFSGIARRAIHPPGFDPDWAMPTYRLVRIAVVAFALVIAYPYIPGSGSEAFKGISVFMGVLFSLGSTTMIANILAGYNLLYRRTFKVDDYVKIGNYTGIIKEIQTQVTRLHTFKNEEVVIPNSTIIASEVVNYSTSARMGELILHSSVTIGYDAPWRQVEAMLLEAAARTKGLLTEPRPFVLKQGLEDFYIKYEINAYCDDAARILQIYSELHAHIADVFNEYGVQIMSPHFMTQPDEDVVVPKAKWFASPARSPNEGK